MFDSDPTALVSRNLHLRTTAQEVTAGKAIQQIYGSFKTSPYKVIKVRYQLFNVNKRLLTIFFSSSTVILCSPDHLLLMPRCNPNSVMFIFTNSLITE